MPRFDPGARAFGEGSSMPAWPTGTRRLGFARCQGRCGKFRGNDGEDIIGRRDAGRRGNRRKDAGHAPESGRPGWAEARGIAGVFDRSLREVRNARGRPADLRALQPVDARWGVRRPACPCAPAPTPRGRPRWHGSRFSPWSGCFDPGHGRHPGKFGAVGFRFRGDHRGGWQRWRSFGGWWFRREPDRTSGEEERDPAANAPDAR